MADIELTGRERQAIKRLQKAIDSMPDTLWLFSNGTMYVMKYKPDGRKAQGPHYGYDQDYSVATIDGIESDGGDW